jgi:hypothetical protein
LSSRNIPVYRQPAVILIDQLKEIYIDAVLQPVETANWFLKIYRKDYRRPGPAILRKLCLWGDAQLHRLLQSGG